MSERILVRKIEENLWQWRDVNSQGAWSVDAYYTGDINLLKETMQGKLVWLILPGQNVVAQVVTAEIKERSQLLKVLPYEIEEHVVDAIEDMQFSYGEVKEGKIAVAYGDFEWLRDCIAEIEATGTEVILCSVDYLQLPRDEDAWTLLLENGVLMALTADGEGFAIEQSMAPLYLSTMVSGQLPKSIKLYADCDEALYSLTHMLPESITGNADISLSEEVAGFWDVVSPNKNLKTNFRSGKLARKLPFAKWWSDYKYPIMTTAAAFLLALATSWLGQSKMSSDRKYIVAQTDEIYRQVVPNGKVTEPSRQLRAMLGGASTDPSDSSNVVYLISSVGPAISAVNAIKVKSFRYNSSKKQLQMNIEGSSYEDFEALRGKIAEVGFDVDIKSQSAHGEVFQAQLNVSEAS